MTEKANAVYTDEVVESMVADYTGAETQEDRDSVVSAFAEQLGKSVASVRAKLVREGVYVKKERADKTGRKIQTKDEMVAEFEKNLGLEVGSLESLEKATKNVIRTLMERVQ